MNVLVDYECVEDVYNDYDTLFELYMILIIIINTIIHYNDIRSKSIQWKCWSGNVIQSVMDLF